MLVIKVNPPFLYSSMKKRGLRGLRTIPTLRGVRSPTLVRGILCPT